MILSGTTSVRSTLQFDTVYRRPRTRRDMTIDNLLHGTDDEVEEVIEVAYQMTDRSFHSVRVMKRQLDDYVPV